jgi:hypothetical protein
MKALGWFLGISFAIFAVDLGLAHYQEWREKGAKCDQQCRAADLE